MKRTWTIVRFLGFGFIVMAVLFVGLAAWIGYPSYRIMHSWPAVDADVIDSKAYSTITRWRSNQGRLVTVYGTLVQFHYTVNGREYSSQIDIGYHSSVVGEMEGWARRFVPGTRHRIRYFPEDPNRISLAVGYHAVSFASSVALGRWALALGVLGLALLLVHRRT